MFGALKEEILLHQAEALLCLGVSCSIVVRLSEDVLMIWETRQGC
jgi:hypothetical protein